MVNESDSIALTCYKQIAVLSPNHPVYVVQHEASGRIYVEKVLSRYNREIYQRLMEKPVTGIPHVYEVAEQDNRLYVIEDYIPGKTLQERLDEDGRFSEPVALDLALQLCTIVERLHQSDPPIIHRDIKPTNIMLTPDGELKLLDMNAARAFTNDRQADTFLMGTAGYAAPEQYGFAESSLQTDIYAIGVLINVMLTGKLPTEELAGGLLSGIIRRCTMLEPQKRYPSVQTLRYALRTVQDRSETSDHIPGWRRFLPPGFRSGELTHKLLAAAGYALLIYLGQSTTVDGWTVGRDVDCYRAGVTVMLLAIVLFSGNYLDVQDRLPLTRSRNPVVRVLGVLLGNLLLFAAAVIVLAIILSVTGSELG